MAAVEEGPGKAKASFKRSFAAYFSKPRAHVRRVDSRGSEASLRLARSRSHNSLGGAGAGLVGSSPSGGYSSRDLVAALDGASSDLDPSDSADDDDDDGTDNEDVESDLASGGRATSRRLGPSAVYPPPLRAGPAGRPSSVRANSGPRQVVGPKDHQANSRRLFEGEEFPPSLKGKGRSKIVTPDEDEAEERLSRGGSEFGDVGPDELEDGGRRSKAGDGRGRAAVRGGEEDVEEDQAQYATVRSRSSSAPETPRAPQLDLLTPVGGESLLTPRIAGPVPVSPRLSSQRAADSRPDPRPLRQAHSVSSLPPTLSSSSLPARAPLPFHQPFGARLIAAQPPLEPSHWADDRDFTLGPYPGAPTVDSSSPPVRPASRHRATSSSSATMLAVRAASAAPSASSSGAGTPASLPGASANAGPSGSALAGSAAGQGGVGAGGVPGSGTTFAPQPPPAVGTPLAPGHSGIEIFLDSPDLVLRSLAGNEQRTDEPAVLSGEVQLTLQETTSLKDVSIVLRGVCKIAFHDSAAGNRRHHCDHPLFYHDESFLPGPTDAGHPHSHTLKSGSHRFPFSINLPTTLPASLRTYSGTGLTYYKLKATATRSGGALGGLLSGGLSGGGKWEAKRLLRVARSFEPEAVEWIQTLEIENTWPGKIAYEITLPHKAFAAGTAIPVSLKFSPLMKGVRVSSLTTTIKEQSVLTGKGNATHTENRDVMSCRHEFVRPGQASPHHSTLQPRPHSSGQSSAGSGRNGDLSSADMNVLASRLQAIQTDQTPRLPAWYANRHGGQASGSRPAEPERHTSSPPVLLNSTSDQIDPNTLREIAEDLSLSEDVDAVIDIQVPSWTTPTSLVAPIQVTHKIKWSAYIKNPDGHTSELRCALPIHILAPHLAEESRLASSGVRTLLFGPSGALTQTDFQQADLPSYSEHVRDRVAPLDTASIYPVPSGFVQAPWTFTLDSAAPTPMHSPPPSRPSSPGPTSRASGYQTPAYGSALHDGHHVTWADAELLRTLDDVPAEQVPTSRGDSSQSSSRSVSAPNSRPGSRPGSRPSSRPGSPVLGASHLPDLPSPGPSPENGPAAPGAQATTPSFFSMHLPKPLRALTPMGRSMAHPAGTASAPGSLNSAASHPASLHARLAGLASSSQTPPSAHSPGTATQAMPGGYFLDHSSGASSAQHSSGGPSLSSSPVHTALDPDDPMSRVPSYSIASRGALGGGPVPLSSFIGLPSYEESSTNYRQRERVSPEAATAGREQRGSISMERSASAHT